MAEHHRYQSGRGVVNNKSSLTEEQWDAYLQIFEFVLRQCTENDIGPMEKMLKNMGSHSNMFITHKRDRESTTPLTVAASNTSITAFDYLLRHGASNSLCENVMEKIVQTLDPRFIDVLCKNGVDLKVFRNSILRPIVVSHYPHRSFENDSDSMHGHQLKMLEKLLEAKVDPNASSQSSKDSCCIGTYVIRNIRRTEEQKLEMLELLIKFSMDVDRSSGVGCSHTETLLQAAMSLKHFLIGKYLIDHGADVNALSYSIRSPIHDMYWRATNFGQRCEKEDLFAIFRCFVHHGVDVTLRDISGIALIDRFIVYNKTYADFTSGEIYKRGYEREIKYVIQNCEVALLQNQKIHHDDIDYYFIFSLPVLCYLVQAGYTFEVVCKALLLKGFDTDASEVLKLMSFAEPYLYRMVEPCPRNPPQLQGSNISKRLDAVRVKNIYNKFKENQVGVPSLMQCSVYVLRRHCFSIVNGESDLKTSKSIHSRLLQLSTDFLPAKLVSVLTLERFVVDSDLPSRDGNGCVIEESASERYWMEQTSREGKLKQKVLAAEESDQESDSDSDYQHQHWIQYELSASDWSDY